MIKVLVLIFDHQTKKRKKEGKRITYENKSKRILNPGSYYHARYNCCREKKKRLISFNNECFVCLLKN